MGRDEKLRTQAAARAAPHSPEAEQGALSCVMLDGNRLCGCLDMLKDGAKTFYDLRHVMIYDTMLRMWDKKIPINLASLYQKLSDRLMIEEVGGMAYLNEIANVASSPEQVITFTQTIQDKYLLRKMADACQEGVSMIYDPDPEVESVLDHVEKSVLEVRSSQQDRKRTSTPELVKKAITDIEDQFNRKGAPTGLPTGFIDYDKLTGGLQNGEMIVIAARPSLGKTSLAMNMADYLAIEQKLSVGVFSLEMTAISLIKRIIFSRSRINSKNVDEGYLAERDFPRLIGAAGKLSKAPIYIDDDSTLTILQLRARARRMWQEVGIKVLFIDYLQRLKGSPRFQHGDSRQQEIAEISNGIASLAKELSIPVVVLAQLNRDLEREKDRKPRMSDLRESGAIEQDADTISFLYKPKFQGQEDEEEKDVVSTNLWISKQRNGPQNRDVYLTFLKSYTRFEAASKVSDADVPASNWQDQQADML